MLVLTAPITSAEDQPYGPARIPLEQAEDMIATQPKHAEIIAGPISQEDLRTVFEAIWKNEQREIQELGAQYVEPGYFQQLSIIHLEKGLPLRVGDYMTLHGSLLTALQPNTYALAHEWWQYRVCYFKEPQCVMPGY